MKYLNNESQFTRISDAHARALMESAGYEVPSEESVTVDVYGFGDHRFALCEEVVEAEDGFNYVRLEELDETFEVSLDESGEEILIEFVEFDDVEYILEGVYEGEDGNLYACMLTEADLAGEEDEEEEEEEAEEVDEGYMKKEADEGDDEGDDEDKKDIAMRLAKAKKKAKKKGGMDKKADDKDCD